MNELIHMAEKEDTFMALLDILSGVGSIASIISEIRTVITKYKDKKDENLLITMGANIDYSKVASDLEYHSEKVDEYIELKKRTSNLGTVISKEEREAFKEDFYKKYTDILIYKKYADSILDDYLDRVEMVLMKLLTPGEKLISKKLDNINFREKEMSVKLIEGQQDIKKMISELVQLTQEKNEKRFLPEEKCKEIYAHINKLIFNFDFASAKTMLELFEQLITESQKTYFLCNKANLSFFINDNEEFIKICKLLLCEKMPSQVLDDLLFLLFTTGNKTILSQVYVTDISDQAKIIIDAYICNNHEKIFSECVNEKNEIKEDYKKAYINYVLSWVMITVGNAENARELIERIPDQTKWTEHIIRKIEIIQRDYEYSILRSNYTENKLREALSNYQLLQSDFSSMTQTVCESYYEFLLSFSCDLSTNDFDCFWKDVPEEIKGIDHIKQMFNDSHTLKEPTITYTKEQLIEIYENKTPKTVQQVSLIVNMLLSSGQWEEASDFLKDTSIPAFRRRRLDILMPHEEKNKECAELVDEFIKLYPDDPGVWYDKGIIEDRFMQGSGLEYFEKSFSIQNEPYNAYSTLASRCVNHKEKDDEILRFAIESRSSQLHFICAETYYGLGREEEGEKQYIQALLLSEEFYGDLYNHFMYKEFSTTSKVITDAVVKNCAIKLRSDKDASECIIWIHDREMFIPDGCKFAGIIHVNENCAEALRLIGAKIGDKVIYSGQSYSVAEISNGIVLAAQYCASVLLEKGIIKGFYADPNNPMDALNEMRKYTQPHSDYVNQLLEAYKSQKLPITLYYLTTSIGKTFYLGVRTILLDPSINCWAGCDGDSITGGAVITSSSIALLSAFGFSPSSLTSLDDLCIGSVTNANIDQEIKDYSNDKSKGVLGFENDTPYFVEDSDAKKNSERNYLANLKEWSTAIPSIEVHLSGIDDDLKSISVMICHSDIEAITFAKNNSYTLISDDIVVRKVAAGQGIKTATCMELIIEKCKDREKILSMLHSLAKSSYCTPLTINVLKWISNVFDSMNPKMENEKATILTTNIIEELLKNDSNKNDLYYVLRQLMQTGAVFNKDFWKLLMQCLARDYMNSIIQTECVELDPTKDD